MKPVKCGFLISQVRPWCGWFFKGSRQPASFRQVGLLYLPAYSQCKKCIWGSGIRYIVLAVSIRRPGEPAPAGPLMRFQPVDALLNSRVFSWHAGTTQNINYKARASVARVFVLLFFVFLPYFHFIIIGKPLIKSCFTSLTAFWWNLRKTHVDLLLLSVFLLVL